MKDETRIHAEESSKMANGQLLVGPIVKINLTAFEGRLCHVSQRAKMHLLSLNLTYLDQKKERGHICS